MKTCMFEIKHSCGLGSCRRLVGGNMRGMCAGSCRVAVEAAVWQGIKAHPMSRNSTELCQWNSTTPHPSKSPGFSSGIRNWIPQPGAPQFPSFFLGQKWRLWNSSRETTPGESPATPVPVNPSGSSGESLDCCFDKRQEQIRHCLQAGLGVPCGAPLFLLT